MRLDISVYVSGGVITYNFLYRDVCAGCQGSFINQFVDSTLDVIAWVLRYPSELRAIFEDVIDLT